MILGQFLPQLQPLLNALFRADQRDLVDQFVRHRGRGIVAPAGEKMLLDRLCRRLVAEPPGQRIVEIARARLFRLPIR